MKVRFRSIILIALLAAFASSAAAATAQAENAPYWTVKETRLGTGETKAITTKSTNTFVLTTRISKVKIECTRLNSKEGLIVGSSEGEHGTLNGILEFSTCKVVNNGSSCTVKEPIVTKKLKSPLALDAATRKKLVAVLTDEKGSTLFTLTYSSACTVFKGEASYTGQIVTEVLTDPGELPVEVGKSPGSAKSWLLKFLPTQPTHVWRTTGGIGKEEPVEELQWDGAAGEISGTAAISLENLEEWQPVA